jgi:outer membrane protein TolC
MKNKKINQKMYRYLLIAMCVILVNQSKAQNTRLLGLNDAVKLAISNAEDIKNLQLDVAIQESKNKEVVSSAMPQVSVSGALNYYFSLPQIQFPNSNFGIYEVLQKEGVKDANGKAIDVSKATFSTQNVSFFAPLNTNIGIGVNQLLFQPDIFVAYKARNEVLNFAKANVSASEEKVKESVKKAYYQVLISEEQRKVLAQTLNRLETLLSQTTQMFRQGFVEKLDIEKLQVSINNTQTALNQVDNGIKIALSALKSTMGITLTDSVLLTEKLDLEELKSLMLLDESNFSYEDRKEIGLLGIAKKLENLNMLRQKYGIYPTVAAFANFTRNAQRNEKFNPTDPWFGYNTGIMGLSLTQPIFDGGQRKQRIVQSELNQQKIDNSINMLKRYIDLEKDIAKSSMNNAVLNLEVQERNRKLAQDVFNTTKKKYEAGLGSSFELIQADTELQRAQGSFFQALYDGYVAKIAWDKAVGKL